MRRLIFIFAAAMLAVNVMAQLADPVVDIRGDLHKYEYMYVTPTGSVTASSGVAGNRYGVYGGQTNTVNPADMIGGYLMRLGFSVLPSIEPELLDKTLIVSYGYTGRRQISIFAYASCVVIQFRDAKTHELIASYETEGCKENEADDIQQAIHTAMVLFRYTLWPRIRVDFDNVGKYFIELLFVDETLDSVKDITLRLTYYQDDTVVHVQDVTIHEPLNPQGGVLKTIKRDKQARSKKLKIKAEVISYN